MQEFLETAAQPETLEIPPEPDSETKLAQQIQQLWSVHSQTQIALGRTKEELRSLRHELSRRLYEMKVLLACPGRGGQWSKFLSAQRIPRATADRYANRYQMTINPPAEIASSEAIMNSAEEMVEKTLHTALPKLRDVLANRETAYHFICLLLRNCTTLESETTSTGVTIQKPTTIGSEFGSGVLVQADLRLEAGTP